MFIVCQQRKYVQLHIKFKNRKLTYKVLIITSLNISIYLLLYNVYIFYYTLIIQINLFRLIVNDLK